VPCVVTVIAYVTYFVTIMTLDVGAMSCHNCDFVNVCDVFCDDYDFGCL
jgi:hypothetical protein